MVSAGYLRGAAPHAGLASLHANHASLLARPPVPPGWFAERLVRRALDLKSRPAVLHLLMHQWLQDEPYRQEEGAAAAAASAAAPAAAAGAVSPLPLPLPLLPLRLLLLLPSLLPAGNVPVLAACKRAPQGTPLLPLLLPLLPAGRRQCPSAPRLGSPS